MESIGIKFSLMEEMWFADFEDDEAEERAASSMAATIARLRGVLPIPAVATQLMSLVNDTDHRSSDLAQLISTDAGLSSRMLQVVNSSSYSLRCKCNSVAHAVVLLGPKTVRDTAVALSLLGVFKDPTGHGQKILDHSAIVASLAKLLVSKCERLREVDVYCCALLHDIGKLLMLQADENYAQLLNAIPGELHLSERAKYGFDHAVLAGHVLLDWNIPEPIPTAIAWHHKPRRAFEANNETSAIVAAIRIADKLAHMVEAPSLDMAEALAELVADEAAGYLGLSMGNFREMWPQLVDLCAGPDFAQIGSSMSPDARNSSAPEP